MKMLSISPNSFRKVLIGLGISASLLSPNYVFATSLETYENQSVAAVQQARKITGTLTDAVGEPIIGATVLEKGNLPMVRLPISMVNSLFQSILML